MILDHLGFEEVLDSMILDHLGFEEVLDSRESLRRIRD